MAENAVVWVRLAPAIAWTAEDAGRFETALTPFGPTSVEIAVSDQDGGIEVEIAFATRGAGADFLGDGNKAELFDLLLKDGPLGDRRLAIRYPNQLTELGVGYRAGYRNEPDLQAIFALTRSLDDAIRVARRDLLFPLETTSLTSIEALLEPSPEGPRWRLSVRRDFEPAQKPFPTRDLAVVARADPPPRLNELPWERV